MGIKLSLIVNKNDLKKEKRKKANMALKSSEFLETSLMNFEIRPLKVTWYCLRYKWTAMECDSNMLCMAIRGYMSELPEEQFPKGLEQWPGGYVPHI